MSDTNDRFFQNLRAAIIVRIFSLETVNTDSTELYYDPLDEAAARVIFEALPMRDRADMLALAVLTEEEAAALIGWRPLEELAGIRATAVAAFRELRELRSKSI